MPVTTRTGRMAPKRHLREVGVSERTRKVYVLAVRRFFQYLTAERLPLSITLEQLDEFMVEFVNLLYQDDYALAQAGHTLSGIQRFFPPADGGCLQPGSFTTIGAVAAGCHISHGIFGSRSGTLGLGAIPGHRFGLFLAYC
eukprot:4245412-Amphidinium_carterae.2